MLNTFTVTNITDTAKKDGQIVTIQAKEIKTEMTVLGEKQSTKQLTYYIKVKKAIQAIGGTVDLDPDAFTIVERPYTLPEGVDAGKEVMLKWLQLK